MSSDTNFSSLALEHACDVGNTILKYKYISDNCTRYDLWAMYWLHYLMFQNE